MMKKMVEKLDAMSPESRLVLLIASYAVFGILSVAVVGSIATALGGG